MLEDNLLLGLSLAGIGATVVFVIVVNFFVGREVKNKKTEFYDSTIKTNQK